MLDARQFVEGYTPGFGRHVELWLMRRRHVLVEGGVHEFIQHVDLALFASQERCEPAPLMPGDRPDAAFDGDALAAHGFICFYLHS